MLITRVVLILVLFVGGMASADGAFKERIVILGGGPTRIGLFLAHADGFDERPLLPGPEVNYNPSFSADGKWIVFTSDRGGSADIYRVHPNGTGLQRLTDNPAFDDQGALSPNDSTLAFISTRERGTANVWLLDLATHHARNLTHSSGGNFRPSWSPDGKWIAFTSDRNQPLRRAGPGKAPPIGSGCCGWELVQSTALYIVHPDGSGLRQLTPVNGFSGSPKWSADSKRIVYYEGVGDGGKGASQIVSIDITNGTREVLTSGEGVKLSPQYFHDNVVGYLLQMSGKTSLADTSGRKGPRGDMWTPSWSPNGQLVVYARPLAELGTEPDPVIPAAGTDPAFTFYRTSTWISYSPDGRKLVFAPGNKLMMKVTGRPDLKELFRGAVISPTWSRDGHSIAFGFGRFFARNPVAPTQIALVHADGSGVKVLTQGDNSSGFPSFSPDGKQLVYRVLGQEHGLRIVSLESGAITKLTTEWDNFPAWSSRGDRILFTRRIAGNFEIFTIRPDGSDLRQLTHDHGNDAHALWAPDGRSILFTSSRLGWRDEAMLYYTLGDRAPQSYGKLFIMRADGSGLRQVTDDPWEEMPAAWLPPARAMSAVATH